MRNYYPQEGKTFLSYADKYGSATSSLFSNYGKDNVDKGMKEFYKSAEQIRSHLYEMDFNTEDFTDLVRKLLLFDLFKDLYNPDADKPYKHANIVLSSKDPKEFDQYVANVLYNFIGVKYFDLKIPTAVPRKYMNEISVSK